MSYVEACGHYRMAVTEGKIPPEACLQAIKVRTLDNFTEWSPCATLICELEAQRKGRWGWDATIDGVVIHVSCRSGGHCDAWRKKGFKPLDYRALAEVDKAEKQNQEKKEEKVVSSGNDISGSITTVGSGVATSISTHSEVDDPKWNHSQGDGKKNRFKRRLLSLLN
jgi:hypothetical protein